VIEACRDFPQSIDRVFGGRHGIEGVLREELIDLNQEDPGEVARLKHTPSAGTIGTCRYKLRPEQQEDFQRIIDVFRAHDVGYFFYIGGNDSMDTARKVADLAAAEDVPLTVVGVPKTIDNDVGDQELSLLDHTPGYGSAARYWAYITQLLDQETRGMSPSEPVMVAQAMGRTAGFIPAAARLADPQREMPLQLYLAESSHDLESLGDNVKRELSRSGRCIVIVSEGFHVGSLGEKHDPFGHIEYGASRNTVAQKVVNHLNELELPVRGQASGQVPGVLQRSTSIFASSVDIEEAYEVARHAVELGAGGTSGVMATIRRAAGGAEAAYRAVYDAMPLETVANSHRALPASWLSADQLDVTDDFIRYAAPLIGTEWPSVELEHGIQRFARFKNVLREGKLPAYVPQNHR
jgi:6-phosphofructokinase 1